MITVLVTIGLVLGGVAVAEETVAVDRDAWQPAIRAVFEQLDTLELFALATRLGGMTVKVPRELQALPARMIEDADVLREHGVELYVTELEFRDLAFHYDESPDWREDRPLVPTTISFGTLGVSADAKTRLATVPVGATFRNGKLPVDFLPMLDKGFDLNLLPDDRPDEVQLDDVQLRAGGRVTSGIANRFFSNRVAELILEHGVGQTLQLGQGDLITGDAATRLLNVPTDSRRGRALDTLIEGLGR